MESFDALADEVLELIATIESALFAGLMYALISTPDPAVPEVFTRM